jgi:thioesterase domain-containing protein
MLLSLFHHSIGLYAVFVNLVVVLTPDLAAAASQSYLSRQALNDILSRAAPIAGKIFSFNMSDQ